MTPEKQLELKREMEDLKQRFTALGKKNQGQKVLITIESQNGVKVETNLTDEEEALVLIAAISGIMAAGSKKDSSFPVRCFNDLMLFLDVKNVPLVTPLAKPEAKFRC